MSTVVYPCGCWITRSNFGMCEVTGVHHCCQHHALYSQDKTIRQMADEIMAADHPPCAQPSEEVTV